jgi:protein O-GlcNAc transferase
MSGAPGAVHSYQQALAHQAAGRLDAAERCYREALALLADYPQAHHGLANLLGRLDRLEEAAAHYREALRLKPDWAAAQYNLGHLLNRQGRLEEAAQCYRRALRLKPDFPEALNNLAHILNRLARYDEAERSCRAALRLKPDNAAAHNNLGNALSGLCRYAEAEASYRDALRFNPDLPETLRNLGDVLGTLRRYEESLPCYRSALRLRPTMADAWSNLGLALGALGEPEEAERCYDAALRLKPDFAAAQVNRCIGRLRIVYRDEAEIERARAAYAADLDAVCRLEGSEALAAAGKPPFLLAYQGRIDRELQARYGAFVARAMAARHPAWAAPPEVAPPARGEAIRVGILSSYFYGHSNWKIPLKGWLTALDRRRFRLFGYHIGHRRDEETELAQKLCHRFVQGLPSLERWAERIRRDRLHVLLIPGIGMDDLTLRLAALRLAPVQATSWGHPDTTGLPTIDDYLSSALMEPADGEEHYTERLVRLPNLPIWYEPREVAREPVTRAEIGVDEGAVLYWCCQSLYKYLPRYDEVFPRIAARVPAARFVFIKYPYGEKVTALFRERLAAAFARDGVDAARHCVFLPPMSAARFAAVGRLADLFLDSLGWSGCNSTLEALSGDLPVITMAGALMRGRHSAAILALLEMPELIAGDVDAYVELAAALGLDVERRFTLKKCIAARKHRLYRDQSAIDGLAAYLEEAARRPPRSRHVSAPDFPY